MEIHRTIRPLRAIAIFLLTAFAIAATATVLRGIDPKEPSSKVEKASAANIANDAELARLINDTIDHSEFTSARWGVHVVSLGDGHTIYSRNADQLFTPASNMKVYTTAVALDLLGADYRWRTSVYAASQPDANGVVAGDLILYGRGAPDFTSRGTREKPSSLSQLVDALYDRGVRRVRGNVIGDGSYFRGESLGDGWLWNDVQWYFGAEPTALTIDDNEVDLEIKPADKAGDPPTAKLSRNGGDLQVTSDIAVVEGNKRLSVGVHRGLSDNNVHVWGEFPSGSRGFGARLSVHNPAQFAASVFLAALKDHGIIVDGNARSRDFRSPKSGRFDPARATELASVFSRTLGEVVKTTNKESVNLNAELILRTLGRMQADKVTDKPAEGPERGDDQAGLDTIRAWLERNGVQTNNLALHDGCGLSRLDLVTPKATVGLLRAIAVTQSAMVFRDSLPQAGTDGTLGGRLREYKERVFAKTGSLTYDNSLSGFLMTPKGDLVFSIMANDQTSRASSIRLIDQIVSIIADYTGGKDAKPSKK